MEWMWDIHLCVYSCLVPSSFIINGLGVRFYFLAEKLRYSTYNLSLWIILTNCISIQSLHVYHQTQYKGLYCKCAFPNDLAVGSY